MSSVLVGLFVVCTFARAQEGDGAPSAWRTFNSPEGGFAVDFPGVPQPRTEQTSKPGWTLTRHYYELVADSNRYLVGYVDTPPGSASTEQRLNAALNRVIASYARQGGSEVARHNVSVSQACQVLDWQGISMTPNAPTLLVVRLTATPKRSYFLMFATNRVNLSLADAYKRFLESFKVTGYGCSTELVFPSLFPPPGGTPGPIGPIGPLGPGRSGGNTGGGDRTEGGGGSGERPRPNPRDGVYSSSDVTRRAMILLKPQPSYTPKARMNGIQGTVRLRAVLRATGEVTDVSVMSGLPDGLNESAMAAARRIKFTPAEYEGRKVSQRITIEYHFNLY
jgi:TonB family protein